MITTLDRALNNSEALSNSIMPQLEGAGHSTKWVLHYNNDEAILDQVEQLIDQKTSDQASKFVLMLQSFTSDMESMSGEMIGENSTFGENLRATIADFYLEFSEDLQSILMSLANKSNSHWANDEDLYSMLTFLKNDIDSECYKVLLLPHSQGNFYANALYQALYGLSSNGYNISDFKLIGQLSLGAPTSAIGGGLTPIKDEDSITAILSHKDDIILNLMSGLGLSVSEQTVDTPTSDLSAHGLIETFLRVPEIEARMHETALKIANELEPMPLYQYSVASSAMQSAGHNDFDEVLDIKFPAGEEYRYYNVPLSVYESMRSAPSVGAYFNKNIRNDYYYIRFK
ncbi:KTSC domain-containing protein [Catenovulum agarivorans]|nr:KTSC domain-containing protein [Catenovulum agarivorans]